jgi:hypothetical protein
VPIQPEKAHQFKAKVYRRDEILACGADPIDQERFDVGLDVR